MTAISSADDLELTDVLQQLAETDPHPKAHAASIDASVDGEAAVIGPDTQREQLSHQLQSLKATLHEREHALLIEQRRVQDLQQQLAVSNSAAATNKPTSSSQNPFDMMLTLSSEREAALRERKVYKDRAIDAESNVAQLESDLAAAHANAKVQTERANKLAARCEELQQRVVALQSDKNTYEKQVSLPAHLSGTGEGVHSVSKENDELVMLRQRLRDRESRIVELEMHVTDRGSAPTMVGGELARAAEGAFPSLVYTLESFDTPGKLHHLTRATNTIGRSDSNDISLNSSSVSRFHARLLSKPDGMWLIDLRSVNGCHVNDERASSQILNDGDLVTIGDCRFRFAARPQQSVKVLQAG